MGIVMVHPHLRPLACLAGTRVHGFAAPAGDAALLGEAIDDLRRVSRAVRVLGHYPSPS